MYGLMKNRSLEVNNLQHLHATKLILKIYKVFVNDVHEYANELKCNYGDL